MKRLASLAVQTVFDRLVRASMNTSVNGAVGLRMIRRASRWLGDPLVDFDFHGVRLRVPLSHDLPSIAGRLPEYSTAIGRLARVIHDADPRAAVVDVGANVGDTVAIIRRFAPLRILCIEASDFFFSLLRHNLANVEDVHLEKGFVTDGEREGRDMLHDRGTAHAGFTATGGRSATLASYVALYPDISASVALVKTDTDGMDGLILRGSREWLGQRQPILYLEYAPPLWADQGDDARSFLDLLSDMGYRDLMFYDNQGDFITHVLTSERVRLDDLHAWVSNPRHRRYYDIIAFPERHRESLTRFLQNERDRHRTQSRQITPR